MVIVHIFAKHVEFNFLLGLSIFVLFSHRILVSAVLQREHYMYNAVL